MADYRDLAIALGGGYGQDTGNITPDTLATLRNGKKASASDLLGMLKAIGSGSLSNLESLVRGGVAQIPGTAGDLEGLARMGLNKLYGAGGVNVNPTPVLPTTTDILGMMPRNTAARPETAGMEELGGYMSPAFGKVAKPAVTGYAKLAGQEINAAMTGQPTRSLLGQMTPKPKQIFIGENAKTWNKADAEKFLQLEKSGADPVDAWKLTGTFRSPDGKLRQEISDAKSMSGEKLYSWGEATDLQRGNSTVVRRQKALLHPELSAAYPDTKNIMVSLKPNRSGGYYEIGSDNIGVPVIGENNAADRSLMLHELQHAIQQREGFAGGANPNAPYPAGVRDQMIRDQFEQLKLATQYDPTNPYSSPNTLTDEELLQMAIRNIDAENGVGRMQAYLRSAGEAEARAAQNRMNMTNAERRAKFPYESYDVPINDLIVTK